MRADDVSQEPKFTQFMSQRAIADSDAYSCTYPEVQPEKEPEHRRTIAIETKSGNCLKLFRSVFELTVGPDAVWLLNPLHIPGRLSRLIQLSVRRQE